jgi:hypothetical protein
MKLKIKTNNIILLILSIISFTCLIYILYHVNTNIVEALNIDKSKLDTSDYIMGFGHILILLFHFYAIIFIFICFHRVKEFKILKIVLLILGVISLFAIGGEKVMVDEISREYRFGLDISELYILNSAYLINMVFTILMFLLTLKTFRLVNFNDSKDKFTDENIFIIAQCMGIFSGVMGLLFTFDLIEKKILINKLWIFIPFYILFLVPYGLAVIYWLSQKLKQRINDWYDEKQLQDILKSSLTTLLLSVPGLAIFLFIKIPSHFYFFMYYVFLILLIFSGSTLYFFKIKDIS